MSAIIIPIIVGVFLTAVLVPVAIRLAYRNTLFDGVDERKVHSGMVPRLGGSSFLLSTVVGIVVMLLLSNADDVNRLVDHGGGLARWYFLGAAVAVIYIAGLVDDIRGLGYGVKFLSQLASACLIVFAGGFWFNNFYGLFGIGEVSAVVGQIFTVFFIVFVANSYNLIDGIDGLASMLGVLAMAVVGGMLLGGGQMVVGGASMVLAASLATFFCYNKFGKIQNKTKIFMGDGGSQTMGLVIAFLIVYVSVCGHGDMHTGGFGSFVISLSVVIIPCFDAVRVMLARIVHGRNPFLPDCSHIHHKFLRIGFGHTAALISIMALAFAFVALNCGLVLVCYDMAAEMKINLIVGVDIVVWCVVHGLLNLRLRSIDSDDSQRQGDASFDKYKYFSSGES